MKKFSSVDEYLDSLEQWQAETKQLRKVLLSIGIEETLKWSMPVYVAAGKNIVGISSMKGYFGIWFYQGALLADAENVLINAQEGKTKAMRQWRMTSTKDIKTRTIKKYVLEAIALAEQGKEIKPARNKPLNIPIELQNRFAANEKLAKAFESMTKTRKREYADYISEAKRDDTKQRRLEKIVPMILEAKGLHDKYRS